MSSSEKDSDSTDKLGKHLQLLKEEYTKLQRGYEDLERKYNKVAASGGEDFSGFVSRLVILVSSLYKRKTYSDIVIKFADGSSVPAHKFVLNVRSEEWREDILADKKELDWTEIENVEVGMSCLRWIYTDAVDLQNDSLALGLLETAHRFKLPGLLDLCERALVASVDVRTCVRFYCMAEEVGASSLLQYCSNLISTHWDDLSPNDFIHMSGPLLHKMLKGKTKFPLHEAVRLLREDVVFLLLVENDSQLSEFVNKFSPQGQLPLQLALLGKNAAISETLVKNGSADVNAYDGNGNTLLIDAVKRGDAFSAHFLLDKNCDVNLTSRSTSDTALHHLVKFSQLEAGAEVYEEMIKIGEKILSKQQCSVNIQNACGLTPLHMAISSGNDKIIHLLLQTDDIDVNIKTIDDKCALQLALTKNTSDDEFQLAKKLLEKGVTVTQQQNGDSLLQFLIKENLEQAAIFLISYSDLNYINSNGLTALHLAASKNMKDLVEKLLKQGAIANLQSSLSDMKSPLHFAVESNAFDIVKVFVDLKETNENIDFNIKDCLGNSPLSLAISLNNNDLIPILIEGGADLNARNGQDLTLLHQAILNHDSKTAKFLLNQGADFNALTGEQESALQLAIHCHLPDVVDALCVRGVIMSAPDNKGDPPLWTALELNYEDISNVLVKHGVDTDCWGTGPDGCQQTLLHRAIDENKENIAGFLIKNGCDLDTPRQPGVNGEGGGEAKDKASPLHLCAQWGLFKVIEDLIDHNANVNSVDILNRTPLHIAIENQQESIIRLLLCHPSIDLKSRDKNGLTPFASALRVRNHKAAQQILEKFPTAAEQMDQRGRNFLHIAIMKDDLESVLFLLGIQVDVNSRVHDVNKTPPLHLASASKNEMILRNLILAGSRINEVDATQKSALHVAVERGNLGCVTALIQNGADFDAVDGEGNNALHIAVREGYQGIVKELLTESSINAEALNLRGRNPLLELCRTCKDNNSAGICELFLELMPNYPINFADLDGNTPLLLAFMRGQAALCKVLVKNGAVLGHENKDGVTIFNFKLATDQLLHNLLDILPKESPWSKVDTCQECGVRFSLTIRKHHCRHCGRELCSKCSNNDVPIIKFGLNKPVRVCRICFDVLQVGSNTYS